MTTSMIVTDSTLVSSPEERAEAQRRLTAFHCWMLGLPDPGEISQPGSYEAEDEDGREATAFAHIKGGCPPFTVAAAPTDTPTRKDQEVPHAG